MANGIIEALEMLVSLQRWNFLPRIEIWTEAENAAYVAHLCYGVCKEALPDPMKKYEKTALKYLIEKSMLQSLRKNDISDIPRHTIENLIDIGRRNGIDYYCQVLNNASYATADLFPKPITNEIINRINKKIVLGDVESEEYIENIFIYCKAKAALEECSTNIKVYDWAYAEVEKEIYDKITKIPYYETFNNIVEKNKIYFSIIRKLKYLRRWNRINRSIETSVLAHTYLVALLALIYGLIEKTMYHNSYGIKVEINDSFILESILKSMFHDVVEGLTGDLITPVKRKINALDSAIKPDLWTMIEQSQIDKYLLVMPASIQKDVKEYSLLDELAMDKIYKVPSFVKYCDLLAMAIECIFELKNNPGINEMKNALRETINKLKKSEWTSMRDASIMIMTDYSGILVNRN